MTTLNVSTKLAFDRTRVAFDRTMMAWIRTATSLITFGFSVYKFFQLEMERNMPNNPPIGPREFSLLMVVVGLISLMVGTVEHRRNMQSLLSQYPEMPRSRTGLIATLLSLLGVLALTAVIFRQ